MFNDWNVQVTVNFEDYEIDIEFYVIEAYLKDLMGAVVSALWRELPKYNREVKDITSLQVIVVPKRQIK